MSYEKRPLPIGKKLNNLKIIEEVQTNKKGRRFVYCLCKCGSKKVIRYDMFLSGKVKSCGCLLSNKNKAQIEKMVATRRRNREKVIAEDYVGKEFSNLTIEDIYHHPKYKGTWFVLKCKCGKIIKASLAKLKQKHVKSCGCIRRKYDKVFVSEIDKEEIVISSGKSKYFRILPTKTHLHVHEAKKAFSIKNKQWHESFVVHHIDGDKLNNILTNLAVLENNGRHRKHHSDMERAMYLFLKENDLLEDFYAKNKSLRLTTLADILI